MNASKTEGEFTKQKYEVIIMHRRTQRCDLGDYAIVHVI